MFNVAIVGMGFIYSRHKNAIEAIGGKVILTCDIDKSKHPVFSDYKEMFKSQRFKDQVDIVTIATPNCLHHQMALDALATGKIVLVEKPFILDNNFDGLEKVNTVLQLRYHDLIPEIRQSLTCNNQIDLVMKVYRDEAWWNGWHGSEEKSGGILFSLGIHMIDILIFLLGDEYDIIKATNSRRLCTGTIKFPTALVKYHIEVMETREGQTRSFTVNGKNFELCNADNLSFSGYHHRVYEELIKGNGILPLEAKKSIELVLKLKEFGKT